MKRRERGEGGVYLRGNLWWIFYQKNGKKVMEGSGSRIKTDALKLLKERLAYPANKDVLVSDLLDMLLQDYEDRGKKGVYKSASHLKPVYKALGHLRVVDITEDTVERYQRERLKTHSNGTINRESQMLGQALNKLAYRKRIISRPVYIRKLEEFNIRRDFFEPWEVEKVVGVLPDYLQDFVRFAHISSWRKNEISTLTWEDISLPSQMIRLDSAHNKTGDTKILPIVGELATLIAKRQQERVNGCPYVFHRKGRFIRDFRKWWYKATTLAGCEGRVFHALRRSSVRDKIRSGTHEGVAMKISGHKTRAMLDRYNISSENDIVQALHTTEKYRKLQLELQSELQPQLQSAKALK